MTSVADFPDTYLQLWRDGGTVGVELKMPDKKKAVALRHRLYRLRDQMRVEKHDWLPLAAKAIIRISFTEDDKEWVPFSSDPQIEQLVRRRIRDKVYPANTDVSAKKHDLLVSMRWKLQILPDADQDLTKILADHGYKDEAFEPPKL